MARFRLDKRKCWDKFPRYVLNQLNIFVPVGNDINIVIPVKYALVSVSKPMSNDFLFLF